LSEPKFVKLKIREKIRENFRKGQKKIPETIAVSGKSFGSG